MRSWPTRSQRRSRIEIIPMIDVMMFLLVFFVLISLHTLPSLGLKVALPHASTASQLDAPERVTVTLTADGDVYLNGSKTTLGSLTEQLKTLAGNRKLIVIVAGDQNAHLQPLVSVL